MIAFNFQFQIAALFDPHFLGDDDDHTLLTMEANRLAWDVIPMPGGDRANFAIGYVTGREDRNRDMPRGVSLDYDLGYDCGVRVQNGQQKTPQWDREVVLN
jgi:hypothetical protein